MDSQGEILLEKVAPIMLQPDEAALGEADVADAWGRTAEMRELSLRRASVSPPTRTGWPGCRESGEGKMRGGKSKK